MKTCNCTPDEYGHLLDCALLWDEMGYVLTYNEDHTIEAKKK